MTPSQDSAVQNPDMPGLGAGSIALLKDQIEQGSDAFTIACTLSFNSFEAYADTRNSTNDEYEIEAHVRALVLKELHGWKWTELHEFLSEDQRAQTIGYNPEKFAEGKTAPSRTTISRSRNRYFGDKLVTNIDGLAEWIRDYAKETGNLIGDLMVEPEDRTGDSQRTQFRVKREKTHEVAERFRELFYDELELQLPDESDFTEADFYDFFLHIALTGDFANNGADTWREEVDEEDSAPSGDTFREYLRMFDELEENEVTRLFDSINELLWEIADERELTDRFTDVAIDENSWLYYGDSDTPRILEVNPKRGTDKAFQFLTLSVIGDGGERFTVAVKQVASRQEKIEAVKDLVEEADERLFVRNTMLDRGFYGTLFAQALEETSVNYIIRAQAGRKSKQMWEEAENGVNVERTTMSRSYAPYESVEVTRFVVPARDDADAEYMAFITNRELTERQAKRFGKHYVRRWGIETSYRVIGDFLPKTASKDVALRVWYYRMAILLYNVWVLVNEVVKETFDLDVDASPPVTAKYLLTVLRKKHSNHPVT